MTLVTFVTFKPSGIPVTLFNSLLYMPFSLYLFLNNSSNNLSDRASPSSVSKTAFDMHVDMHTRLLKGEEEKPETVFPEYGGTHEFPPQYRYTWRLPEQKHH
jgi:hypothetical protein